MQLKIGTTYHHKKRLRKATIKAIGDDFVIYDGEQYRKDRSPDRFHNVRTSINFFMENYTCA